MIKAQDSISNALSPQEMEEQKIKVLMTLQLIDIMGLKFTSYDILKRGPEPQQRQLNKLMGKMEEEGLLKSARRGHQKIYMLTNEGAAKVDGISEEEKSHLKMLLVEVLHNADGT